MAPECPENTICCRKQYIKAQYMEQLTQIKKYLTKVPEFDIITPALSESSNAANLENDTER